MVSKQMYYDFSYTVNSLVNSIGKQIFRKTNTHSSFKTKFFALLYNEPPLQKPCNRFYKLNYV